jgi:hypothetical protein
MEETLLKVFELLQETGQQNLGISAEILKILSKDSEVEGQTLSDILESIDNRLAAIERELEIERSPDEIKDSYSNKGSSKHNNSSQDQPAQPHLIEPLKQLYTIEATDSAENYLADNTDAIAAATAVTITDIYDDDDQEDDDA